MLWAVGGAILIGLSLGLMGSGGSVLTVPVLTYLLRHDAKVAVAESLAIVGLISLVSVFPYARARQIDWRSVWSFGLPGMIGTYIGAWIGAYVSSPVQLLLFAGVILVAAWLMLRSGRKPAESTEAAGSNTQPRQLWHIASEGLGVGVITGLVGVGGGFLIVPALVLLGRLPMKQAIGTSLAIIFMKSASGFYKYADMFRVGEADFDWQIVSLFVALGVFGGYFGKHMGSRLNPRHLQFSFGVFLLLIGLGIILKETPMLISTHWVS